jgi:hypothetical protein
MANRALINMNITFFIFSSCGGMGDWLSFAAEQSSGGERNQYLHPRSHPIKNS